MKFQGKRFLFFLPVIAGILLLVVLMKNKPGPARPHLEEMSRPVNVIEVRSMRVFPRIRGYGYAEPSETWQAIPEVSGRVVEIHPDLKKGTFLKKGEVLFKIDPQNYGLAESREQASVMNVEAQLRELSQQKENTARLLEIETQALELGRKELARKKELHKRGFVSLSELELEEKSLLAQEKTIKNLQNSLDLIPSQQKALLAQKESGVSTLDQRRLDLERTIIRAPFDCRISEVRVELNEYASVGSVLAGAISIDKVEIPVKLTPGQFASLLPTPFEIRPLLDKGFSMENLRKLVGLSARVRLPMFHKEAVWKGEFRRTGESVDPETGALTVFVAVDKPYEKIRPGVRPPLVPGLYCEVELQGRGRDNRFVVPASALHGGELFLLDSEKRLERRKVTVETAMDDYLIISGGLSDKEMVVLTDLVPAISGMLLTPVEDEDVMQAIEEFAREDSLKEVTEDSSGNTADVAAGGEK